MTDTFSGISPNHVMMFILLQLVGALLATFLMKYLLNDE